MERRRSLGGFFKFFVDPMELNFAYGKKKTLTNEDWLLEVGTVSGTYTNVTKNGETYWKVEGRGAGLETVIFINFKTYKANQVVQFKAFDECNSPNDFLAIGKLDSIDKSPLKAKLNNSTVQTISFTVPTAGSHFIKVYYYQHNDADTASYSVSTHTTHAGYIKLIPYYNQYEWGYDNPDTQQILIKSYTGWVLKSKPSWVNVNKTYDRSGKKYLTIECQGNPDGTNRSGLLVLKEKRKDTEISVTINQAKNPHPNDIILAIDKSGGIVNETSKSIDIGVKLIGETSYTISNVSTNYSVTKSSDGKKITVTNNTVNTSGKQNVSFKVTGNNGTSKDINIYEDSIECYCDCNTKNACGCDINRTYTQRKLECTGCHSGNDSCIGDNGSCSSHQGIYSTCSCYGSKSCSGCHTGYIITVCTCNGSVGCSGCNSGNVSSSCSCNGSQTCSGCNSGYTATACTCNGSVGCSGCKSGYTASSCSCNSSKSCSGCNSGNTTSNCLCYSSYDTTYRISTACTCNWGYMCSLHYITSSCSCNGSQSCYGCHSGNTASSCTCNSSNSCTGCHYGKTTKGCTCQSSYSCSRCYGGYFPNRPNTCPCNQSYSCNGCYYGYVSASSCSCNNGQSCTGCHSGNTSSACTCNKSVSCSGCNSGYSTSCQCHNGQGGCWGCNYGHGVLSGCDSCYGGWTETYCTCYNSYACSGCNSGKTNASCTCNGSVSCTGCNSGKTNSSCSCNGSVGCSGCKSGYTASSCSCNGSQACSGCNSGYTPSSCSCNGAVGCTGCDTAYTEYTCTCNSKVFHPQCDCHQYCPCEGYVIPVVN